ncbi:transmembrane protease serine 11G-like [Pan paniscus]|uniref:transmembrane protease serine 11G-like n=1 Tax=Pan paniscus TaxID=9597 RepID=UPI001560F9A4|nr:transmembrane protease serine 11G-like [Pan paniscus]
MVALIVRAVMLILVILIGLLVYFLAYGQKFYYYQTSSQIPSIEYNPDFSVEHSKLSTDLKQKVSNEIDKIFQRSNLNHHYIKCQVVNFRPSNDNLKADVLLKFQFIPNNENAIKTQADNIFHQKLKSNESFLKTDTSLPYLRGFTVPKIAVSFVK